MGKHRRAVNGTDKVRVKAGGVLLTGLLSGAVATGAFTGAPTANASCFSAFGIGNGNGCTSNMTTIAIGIGEGAIADASFGILGGAVAIGTNASATNSISLFTGALAFGPNATASALFSIFSTLAQFGPGMTAVIGGPNIAIGASAGGPPQTTSVLGGFNIGAQLGPGSTQVLGGLNFAMGVSPFGNGAQETVAGLFATFALNLIGNSAAYRARCPHRRREHSGPNAVAARPAQGRVRFHWIGVHGGRFGATGARARDLDVGDGG